MSRRKSQQQSALDLEQFAREAQNGATDEYLARCAGVTPNAVRTWRRRRRLLHRTTKKSVARALDPYLQGWEGGAQLTEGSPILGRFVIPEMLLREPINYNAFATCVHSLYRDQRMREADIAKALGFRVADVEMAIALEAARLSREGLPCKTCGRVTDPNRGVYCGAVCCP